MKRQVLGVAGLLFTGACLATVNANPAIGVALGLVGITMLFLCGG